MNTPRKLNGNTIKGFPHQCQFYSVKATLGYFIPLLHSSLAVCCVFTELALEGVANSKEAPSERRLREAVQGGVGAGMTGVELLAGWVHGLSTPLMQLVVAG